ncbi:DUF6636 domain-containing protein [Falsiroseomonas oryziterrae]|uniref:DUF6636 domain-containing protein n=1 Tax=Falsiroseomonas oryziterrae TaxID=2911368 RepID=UPI001F267A58|nr:DUF6636 domain-containing protein [Roseomonas sp. NPKOSM-4]
MRARVCGMLPALLLAPVVASAQPGFQPPPPAFQTPSGNVHCRLTGETLRCEALARDFAPPAGAAACQGGWPGALALRATGEVGLPCDGGSVRNDEAFVLGYGARWSLAGISCDSEEAGLRCANPAGHGFQVSRSRLTLF